jgi:hypothetical protein
MNVSLSDVNELFYVKYCYLLLQLNRSGCRTQFFDLQHERGPDGSAQSDHQQRANVQTGFVTPASASFFNPEYFFVFFSRFVSCTILIPLWVNEFKTCSERVC